MYKLVKGTEFKDGKSTYAFIEYNGAGNITAVKVGTDKTYTFRPHITADSLDLTGGVNEAAVDAINEAREAKAVEKKAKLREFYMLERNQYFTDIKGRKFIFEKMNRTKFSFRDDEGNGYKASPGFFESALNEFANEKKTINPRLLDKGQVFSDNKDKKFVFIRMKQTKFICCDYNNHNSVYDASPGLINKLEDEIVELKVPAYLL